MRKPKNLMKIKILIFSSLFVHLCLFANNDKILRFKHITTDNGLPNNSVYSIIQDKYGFIWIGTLDGLCRFDGYTMKIYRGNSTLANAPINNRPISMANDSRGNLYISFSLDDKRVCRYNFETDDFSRIAVSKLDAEIVKRLRNNSKYVPKTVENSGYRWDISSKNLCQTSKKSGHSYCYHTDPRSAWAISDDIALSIYLDKQNVLWIGTDNGGVCYADLAQPDFRFSPLYSNAGSEVKETIIRSILEDKNRNMWIGLRNEGLIKMDSLGSIIKVYRKQTGNSNGLQSSKIRKLVADREGNIWIGTKEGLDRLNPKNDKIDHFVFDKSAHDPLNYVFSVFEDSENQIWAGTWHGLAHFDSKKKQFSSFFSTSKNAIKRIRDIVEDKNNNFWIATQNNGLVQVHKNKRGGRLLLTKRSFVNIPGDANSLSDNWLYCLCLDEYGNLWIGTGSGINLYNPTTNKFTRFNNHLYIGRQVIHGIEYDNGSVWVSHQNGLTEINCKTLNTRDYSKKYDFFENDFCENSIFKNKTTGRLFVGGSKGYISFRPKEIRNQPEPPKVFLTNIKVSNDNVSVGQSVKGQIILTRPLYLSNSVRLNWDNRNIQLQFAAIFFPSPEVIKYSYRLKGFDSGWVSADADSRTAVYSNLPDGKYIFEVRAANPYGKWSPMPTQLEITIFPPWWRTWWAYTVYTIFALGILVLLIILILNRQKYHHDIRIERMKAEKAREMDQLKTRMFTNISHEFRTPLTLIIDPIDKLLQMDDRDERSRYYHQLISKNAHRLMELVNQFLDLRKIEAGKLTLNIKQYDFIQYLHSLVEYFDLHAKLNHIDFSLSTDCEHCMAGFDTEKMDKILLNILMNAFKHTSAGGRINILTMCDVTTGNITLEISDTGNGIPANQINNIFEPFYQIDDEAHIPGTGIGLTLVRELVKLHRGEIDVESVVGQGTVFTIKLPIISHHTSTVDSVGKMTVTNISNYLSDIKTTKTEPATAQNLTILLIEDHPEVLDYLASELSDMAAILTSNNGIEGFEQAKNALPDIIVTDVMMPEMTGFELCKLIKTNEATSHIPVILLTAQQSDDYKISGYHTGADAYLTKPFNTSVLKARIQNLLDTRKKLRSLFDKSTDFNTNIVATNPLDKVFLQKAESYIIDNLNSSNFDVEVLASKMNLSRTQLYRKIKNLTGKSVQEFIVTIKLKKSTEYLLSGDYNITQVAEMLGISDVGNFSRIFIRIYGMTPSEFRKSHSQ